MRRFYTAIGALLILCCFACSGNKNNNPSPTPASLILGSWTLQQQHVVQYVNAVKKVDTTIQTSNNNVAMAKFDKAGTYTSSSSYNPNNGNLGSGASSVQMGGTYSFNGDTFSMTNGLAGLNNSLGFIYATTTPISTPVIAPGSFSSQISQITASKLNLHIETIYTVTVDNISQTYKVEDDYQYSK